MSVRADQRSESSLLFYKIARELRREISCDLLNKFNTKKEELQNALKEISKLCEKYKIRLNPKKTRITPIKHGVDFLHCRYKFGRTGKIIKSGGRESVKRERRKLKKFRKKLDEGELDRKQIAEFYSSWRGFMQYFDSKTLLKNTDKLYNKLFIEG